MTGTIFSVKHFAVHDGPGIRTTLFFKGCPLSCLWCHNPEGKSLSSELALYAHKCTLCRVCENVCKSNAHIFNGAHLIDRAKCIACGECADKCLSDALTLFGKRVTVDEILPELLEDRAFYENSGGGVTLSGGECLLQADFVRKLLEELKREDIHTAVDTCGFVPQSAFARVMELTDVFLYDIKADSEETHIKCTGHSNKLIWENLEYLLKNGKEVTVRIPLVPEYNSHEIEGIARRLSELKKVSAIDVLKYHNFSSSKYSALDMENTMPCVSAPSSKETERAKEILRGYGLKVND